MNQVVVILTVLSIAAIILALSQGAFDNESSDPAPPAPILLPAER